MSLQETITLQALQNALKFKGKANPKALIGGIVREHPDARSDMVSLTQEIDRIVSEINALSPEEQEQKLLELDPEHKEKQQAKKQERKAKANELPELPNAVLGKVVTRIPPEPSKYTHLGHAMSFLINYLYAKKYEGRAILRLDDTNPEKESQEFVNVIENDVLNYLGIEVSETLFASDHMQTYMDYAQKLIDEGNAYTCNCKDIAEHRRNMTACSHNDQSKETTQQTWKDMLAGKHDEYVLRLKIDMAHKNAVMRDPVIFRVVNTPHYRQGTKYHVWPMYDFETAIEEGLCGITHVLRSNEFDQRIELHNHIASLFGFPEVTYKHYGRYNVTGATTQGREIREKIESGEYLGWDDPRLVTLVALKRRGIVKEAYYVLAQQIGLSKTQTNLDFGVIAAVNRNLLDEKAKRFFAVRNPIEVTVSDIPEGTDLFSLSYHPHGTKGERKLSVTTQYYIEQEDHDACMVGSYLRFMDAMTLKKTGETSYSFVGFEHDKSLGAKLIHFVPKDGREIKATVLLPTMKKQELICEPNIAILSADDVIQFERYAFCRLDSKENGFEFWFTHE
ncbi:MAG: glutamate--tRNA ligase [Nanoarchaeota archaeon]|nr:glutamate--tRNA ligase [Nanoarchaeota archaeon]